MKLLKAFLLTTDFPSWHSNQTWLMLPSNMQHIIPLLAAFSVCQVPIKFRADTKLTEAGLCAYNAAAYNFIMEACIFGFSVFIIVQKICYDI